MFTLNAQTQKDIMGQSNMSKREPACFIRFFFPFLLMHVAHCDRTSTEEGEKKLEKTFL